ncbi:MAG: CDP-glucose 4,6-dehydratase [Fibrobacterota bacterium]
MKTCFNGIYNGKKVLVTGHTGFKGSWLALWLTRLGATVTGFALKPPTEPNHFDCLGLPVTSVIGDIRDAELLAETVRRGKPDIVFHLAAQAIVRAAYTDPAGTYASNVMGTLNVCEACRNCDTVRALVAITTDKVYRNREWWWGYRENDELGGYDPYSSSKACADILLSSYRNSFLNPDTYGTDHRLLMAVTRAGNVIGGGDWAQDRLLPDLARAAGSGKPLLIRNPLATRPWQHVLECLSGYLLAGQKLLEGKKEFGTAFNFGPTPEDVLPVGEIIQRAKGHWLSVDSRVAWSEKAPHEARSLMLDCSKARAVLGWAPIWDIDIALKRTLVWYREYYLNKKALSENDLEQYTADATERTAVWTR